MSSVYYATVPPTPVGVLQTPISANTNAGVTASAGEPKTLGTYSSMVILFRPLTSFQASESVGGSVGPSPAAAPKHPVLMTTAPFTSSMPSIFPLNSSFTVIAPPPTSRRSTAGANTCPINPAPQSVSAPPIPPEYDGMKYYNDFIRPFYGHRVGTNADVATPKKEQQTLTTAAANAAVDVDFAARFDRLERMLEGFNCDATMIYDASENARLDYLAERFDRFEEKLEDLLLTQGNTHKNQLDQLNARFDRLEQRMAAVDLNGATQACSSCDGLTITVKHGGSR
ncbi:hypothetical protein ONZ45_g10987 [Pleurotus djamor]|nr:hypothetical protein ONZ45_g10987 [Pleurotus djamor]